MDGSLSRTLADFSREVDRGWSVAALLPATNIVIGLVFENERVPWAPASDSVTSQYHWWSVKGSEGLKSFLANCPFKKEAMRKLQHFEARLFLLETHRRANRMFCPGYDLKIARVADEHPRSRGYTSLASDTRHQTSRDSVFVLRN